MRTLRLVLGIIVLLVVVLTVGGIGVLLATLPRTSGTQALAGLAGPVTITRDSHGVPHIKAGHDTDAFFALGFVHAQDRLWQMEFQRRVGNGQLAEVLGQGALPVDRFMRTMGLTELARGDEATLSPEAHAAFAAYVAGINAYIAHHQGPLPPEFLLLRDNPEPWTVPDVLVWARVMAFQLSTNWREELLRARLAKAIPPNMVADLWPGYPITQPVTVGLANRVLDRMLAAIPAYLEPRLESNEWVVAGSHTASGKPLLANDPHLDFAAPILWYLATLDGPGLHVAGGTVPGLPVVVLGHNADIAWGQTTTTSDTMDVFVEQPADDGGYQTPDGTRPYETRREAIHVKGAADMVLTIRATRHGPVVSDLIGDDAQGQVMALSASFLQPRSTTAQGFYDLERATDWDQFTKAVDLAQMPQQNYSYADRQGHIGFAVGGLTPIRKSGDGTLPQPGADGKADWTGWVPPDALPRTFDPPTGLIVNANNKVAGDNYPYLLAATWPEGYRAQRITDLLTGKSGLKPDDLGAMQMDERSLAAVDLLPLLTRVPEASQRAEAARKLLAAWDGTTAADRPEPLIFESWAASFQTVAMDARLGPLSQHFGALRPLFLKQVLSGPTSPWCGDKVPASCDALVARALTDTLADLAARFGDDPSKWRWGDAHVVAFDALLFSHIPMLDRLTGLTAHAGGDGFTVQRGAFGLPELDRPGPAIFTHRQGAGLRAVYDLADLDASRFIIATGQSGNPMSPHWADLLEPWRRGEALSLGPIPPDSGASILTLAPPP